MHFGKCRYRLSPTVVHYHLRRHSRRAPREVAHCDMARQARLIGARDQLAIWVERCAVVRNPLRAASCGTTRVPARHTAGSSPRSRLIKPPRSLRHTSAAVPVSTRTGRSRTTTSRTRVGIDDTTLWIRDRSINDIQSRNSLSSSRRCLDATCSILPPHRGGAVWRLADPAAIAASCVPVSHRRRASGRCARWFAAVDWRGRNHGRPDVALCG